MDEHTGKRTIEKKTISENIKTSEMSPVGRYGVKFHWSDGHQTGSYSFEYLRKICPCGECGLELKEIV